MDVKTVIQLGIKVLQDNEWGQFAFHRRCGDKDYYCASGALEKGVFPSSWTGGHDKFADDKERSGALRATRLLLMNKAQKKGSALGLVHYNDYIASSKEDIIALFNEVLEEIQ